MAIRRFPRTATGQLPRAEMDRLLTVVENLCQIGTDKPSTLFVRQDARGVTRLDLSTAAAGERWEFVDWTGTVNDYALPEGVTHVGVTLTGPGPTGATLTGIAGGADGREVKIVLVDFGAAGRTLTLANQNAGSSVGNRLTLPASENIELTTDLESVALANDGTDWKAPHVQSASTTHRGLVTTGAQSFAGDKTFVDDVGVANLHFGTAGGATSGLFPASGLLNILLRNGTGGGTLLEMATGIGAGSFTFAFASSDLIAPHSRPDLIIYDDLGAARTGVTSDDDEGEFVSGLKVGPGSGGGGGTDYGDYYNGGGGSFTPVPPDNPLWWRPAPPPFLTQAATFSGFFGG